MSISARTFGLLTKQVNKLSKQICCSSSATQDRLTGMFGSRNNSRNFITISCVEGSGITLARLKHNLIQRRFKGKKGKGSRAEEKEEEDDDDDGDVLANENPLLVDDLLGQSNDGSQQMTIDVNGLRLDSFCKTAFGITRAKVEETFYKGDIYLNGARPAKKSADLFLNDEIDFVIGPNPDNSRLLNIKRVVITGLPDKASDSGRMKVQIKRWLDLTIEPPSNRGDD